jgi:tRNA 2-thiouridine synthesizing protein A
MIGDTELDTTGHLCPIPVLKAAKRLKVLPSGAVLRLVASDPAAVIDVPHFCIEQGHALLSEERQGDRYIFRIRRK